MKYLASNFSKFARKYVAFPVLGLVATHSVVQAQPVNESTEPVSAAGGGGGSRSFSIVPRISVLETLTDNVRLESGSRRSDLVSTVSPGLSMRSDAGRLRGFLDYSLNQVLYAREASANNTQNSLNTKMSYEAVSNFAFIDVTGSIGQQAISAFGQQSIDNSSINSNRTEVASVSIAPYIRGRVADFANYQVRYSRTATRSKGEGASDGDVQDLIASLSGESNSRVLNWSATANHSQQKFSLGRTTDSDRLRAVVTAVVNPQFNVSLIAGHESNNFATAEKTGKTTFGLGFDAAFSERTRLNAQIERRFFGTGHSLTFEHRTPHTAWRLSDSKDVSVLPNQLGRAGLGPLYDLLFSQFASIEPDPIRRAILVENFLRANGLNGSTNVNVGFLTSGVTLQKQQNLSFTILGLRDTITLIATRGTSSSLLGGPGGSDDFSTSSAVRQLGWTASYSHRLTQETSLNVLVNQLRSTGDVGSLSTNLKSLNVTVSTRLGLRTTASVGARHSIFDSSMSPYKETAAFGSVSVQF